MEEEWRLLSLRAHIACAICQIYVILCERNEWRGGGGGLNKSNNDLKNNVMERDEGGRAGQ